MSAAGRENPCDGDALVYCEGSFRSTYGKTAHGLVRFTRRYRVRGVVDSSCAGQDAGALLDGRPNGIPVFGSLGEGLAALRVEVRFMVVGLAPDGGRLDGDTRQAVEEALCAGLNVDSGLHDFLSTDPVLRDLAERHRVRIRDIRKPPPRERLHFFTGRIERVDAFKIAVLGTDSAVGKRTTAWRLVDGFESEGVSAELIGTGQTAWLQGARYGLVMDSLVNDFVSGEIEHAVCRAWEERRPRVIVLEGQGSLMNPAYPGGFELLAAGRPDVVVLQHAPARIDYDGFPGYPIHPLARQIEVIEALSGKPVVAVTVNHEGLDPGEVPAVTRAIHRITGVPACDVLLDGSEPLVAALLPHQDGHTDRRVSGKGREGRQE